MSYLNVKKSTSFSRKNAVHPSSFGRPVLSNIHGVLDISLAAYRRCKGTEAEKDESEKRNRYKSHRGEAINTQACSCVRQEAVTHGDR
jgi:hypothetical protein